MCAIIQFYFSGNGVLTVLRSFYLFLENAYKLKYAAIISNQN